MSSGFHKPQCDINEALMISRRVLCLYKSSAASFSYSYYISWVAWNRRIHKRDPHILWKMLQ